MVQDPRKRQKKLERQKAKKKAEQRAVARLEGRGLPAQFKAAADAPILHCCLADDIWKHGIGQILISRQMTTGNVAFAVFMVDLYCLGVKDVFLNVAPRAKYMADLYDKLVRRGSLIPLKPECARKLIEGAVAYALDLGIPPHADYRRASLIFGRIAADACTETYRYGKDGKPFFVAGPNDGPSRCEQIMSILENRCGPGGYHFLMPLMEM
ncbi:MAG: hypothetical protein ABSG68_07375 [Thermoguttaceae bacterium]|jgi:hypothetical protein